MTYGKIDGIFDGAQCRAHYRAGGSFRLSPLLCGEDITEGESKQLRKSCQRTSFDKKTHQSTVEIDEDLFANRLIAACCIEPNLKDAQLQTLYGVVGAEALIDRMLKPGQYIRLATAVQDVNGFSGTVRERQDEEQTD